MTCRTNHVHVVLAANVHPETVRDQLKAWCTRKLEELQGRRNQPIRQKWWTERGSERYLDDENSVENAIRYVVEAQ